MPDDPCQNQPSIEKSVELADDFPTVERRYYNRFYFKGPVSNPENETETLDQVVLVHSNRICLVSLSPNHPVITKKEKITKLDFESGSKRKKQTYVGKKAVGKGKKNCCVVDEKAILAFIETENGSKYPFRSCVRGKVIEINEQVVEKPQLLAEKPFGEGHLAIIQPHKLSEGIQELQNRLLSEEEYNR